MSRKVYLVIGGDGLIGSALVKELNDRGLETLSTTRRRSEVIAGRNLYLDLKHADDFQIPDGVTYAFFLAAAAGVGNCENNQEAAFINSVATPGLMTRLFKKGVFINFASTYTVFNGDIPAASEDASPSPSNDYARQKAAGEAFLLEAASRYGGRAAITRLTRCLGPNSAPIAGWLDLWRAGQVVRPFSDLLISLISVQYAARGLARLAELEPEGIFHLSGQGWISFSDLAVALVKKLALQCSLVQPSTSSQAGVKLLYSPKNPDLGMPRTTFLSGLEPQMQQQAIDDLADDCRRVFEKIPSGKIL